MGGGRMALELDSGGGRVPGSQMLLEGRAFGVRLSVRTEVTEREAPVRKAWQTIDTPRLLVIGPYRMCVDIRPTQIGSRVEIRIDYGLLSTREGVVPEWLARCYARWCVNRMASDLRREFAVPS
jgi:hypothetical protein